jgi:HEAT repeat protein
MIVLLLLLALQEQPRDLIEKLTSDDPVVRDGAAKKLADLGKAAEPELRRAVGHPDPEVAGRVRKLLRMLEIDGAVSPRLKAAMPGIVARLQSGDGHEWTAVFLEIQRLPALARADLEFLAGPALRGAQNDQERMQLLNIVQFRRLRSASAEVEALLTHRTLCMTAGPTLIATRGRDAIPALLNVLRTDGTQARVQALLSLSRLRATEAVPALRDLLKSGDGEVRRFAARSYAEIAGREAIGDLKRMISDADPQLRAAGLSGLAATTLKDVGPDIVAALASPDPVVRSAAAQAAGELRLKDSIPHLEVMLRDKKEELKREAVNVLELYGTRAAAKALLPLLQDPDESFQDEAMRALGELRFREGIPDIVKLLDSKDADRRQEAMKLLGVLGATDTFDRVAQGLKDESEDVRTTAVAALGAIDPARAARLLVPLLLSEKHGSDVEDWLQEAKPHEARAELEKLLAAEKDDERRQRIRETIDDVFGASPETLIARLEDKEAPARVRALMELRSADATPLVVKRLKDAEPAVRLAAVEALERFESKEIQAALADPDPEVLCAAIRGVKSLKLKEAVPALLPLLQSPITPVCEEVAEALGTLGAAEAVPGLIELTRSAFPYVRASAALGLRRLSSPESAAALEALLKDPHPYVRRIACDPRETSGSPAERLAAVRAMTSTAELLAMLEDGDQDVIGAAVVRLLGIGSSEAVVGAARAVDFRDVVVKLEAPREARSGLLELLNDPDDLIRERGAAALSTLGIREAIPRLIERLGGRNPETMIEALADLDAREAVPKIAGLLSHHLPGVRASAATALGTLHAVEAEPGLLELLEDPAIEVRRAAALALAALGSKNAAAKLLEQLVDEDPYVAAALCLLGRREGVPVILSGAELFVRMRGDLLVRSHNHAARPSFLVALNALRTPELCAGLDRKSLGAPVGVGLMEIAKAVARDAGLQFVQEGSGEKSWWIFRPYRRRGLWQILVSASASSDRPISEGDGCEVILDEGKIRLLDFDAALRFWKAWSAK